MGLGQKAKKAKEVVGVRRKAKMVVRAGRLAKVGKASGAAMVNGWTMLMNMEECTLKEAICMVEFSGRAPCCSGHPVWSRNSEPKAVMLFEFGRYGHGRARCVSWIPSVIHEDFLMIGVVLDLVRTVHWLHAVSWWLLINIAFTRSRSRGGQAVQERTCLIEMRAESPCI